MIDCFYLNTIRIGHNRSVCLKMIYTTTVSLIPDLFHVVPMNSKRNLVREDGRRIFFCKLNASGYLNSLPLVSRSLIEWEARRGALRKSEDNGR